MRILLVNDYGVLAGGAERVTRDLRDGLVARGHDARVFAGNACPRPLPSFADYECYGSEGWARPLLQTANPAAVVGLSRVLRKFRPDIVHVRMFLTQLSPVILPLLGGHAALLHIGNYQTICPLNTRRLPDGRPCTRRAGRACHDEGCVSALGLARTLVQLGLWRRHRAVFRRVVANSEGLARSLRENDVDVHSVIWNGTQPMAARRALSGPPTITFSGRLIHKKGIDVLLRAFPLVAARVPDVRLTVIGDGPDRPALEALALQLGITGRVTFRGHLDDASLDRELAGSWVHAVPSRYPEPFANNAIEAMMRGIAVVATDIGGSPEIVRDGLTGFLVPPDDHAHLADRLARVAGDQAVAGSMGDAARHVAIADFSHATMLDRFEALYRSILSALPRVGVSA